MMKASLFIVAALCVVAVSARVVPLRTEAPPGWTVQQRASPNSLVQVQFALKQRNLDVLDRKFWEVSDPTHPNYQNFMTPAEIRELTSPTASEKLPLLGWLVGAGVNYATQVTDFGDSVRITVPVSLAEPMLQTEFYQFQEVNSNRSLIRAMGQATLPAELDTFVEMVTGLSQFPIPHLGVRKPNADYGIVPQTISAMYKVALPTVPVKNTSQGVIEFEGQSFDNNDLLGYGSQLNIPITQLDPSKIIGPMPQVSSVEGLLDIEFIAGVNPQADNWYWYNSPYTKWLYEWGTEFNAAAQVPQVISMSYAWSEMDQCNSGISGNACAQLGVDSFGYVRKVNTEFQKMGLRGVSVLVASGDSGANGRTDASCTAPQLRPDYPASSPFVTSVGGTELGSDAKPLDTQPQLCRRFGVGCAKSGTEQAVSFAVSDYASGGGFSNVADMPSYQTQYVNSYLSSGVTLPPASYFNAKGRAFPDVAGLGHNCLCLISQQIEPVGGTSCATPIFSGIVALLNQASITKSGKPLGFLNPLLYQMYASDPSIYTDIVKGDNLCTEAGCSPRCKGFLATKGWDPVTGLGTPNYDKMLAYVQKMTRSTSSTAQQ